MQTIEQIAKKYAALVGYDIIADMLDSGYCIEAAIDEAKAIIAEMEELGEGLE